MCEGFQALIRAELARSLKVMALEAEGVIGYDTDALESAGLRAVARAAESAAEAIKDTWHSERCRAEYGGECTFYCETNWGDN